MVKKIKLVLPYLLVFVLIGCISYMKKDLSGMDIFNNIVKSKQLLIRPMAIIKQKYFAYYDLVDIESEHYALTLKDVKKKPDSYEILHANEGDQVVVESIVRRKIDQGFTVIIAAGRIYSKEKNDWVSFEYIWANTGEYRNAPWPNQVSDSALKRILEGE